MDPFSYIDRLRKKTDRERDSIAVTVSGIGIAVVFLIWVSITVPKITTMVQSSADDTTATVNGALPALQDIGKAFGEIGDQIGAIKKSVSTIVATGTDEKDEELFMELHGDEEGDSPPAPSEDGAGGEERAPLPGFGIPQGSFNTDSEGATE